MALGQEECPEAGLSAERTLCFRLFNLRCAEGLQKTKLAYFGFLDECKHFAHPTDFFAGPFLEIAVFACG